jgi:hypothetical protein
MTEGDISEGMLCFTAVVRLQVQAAFFEHVGSFEHLGHNGGDGEGVLVLACFSFDS